MNELKKKIIWCFGTLLLVILIFSAGFAIGRYRRLASISESSSGVIESATELKDRNAFLESELERRVAEFNELQLQRELISTGIDRCLDSVGQLREQCDISTITAGDILALVKELRKRFEENERRCRDLENQIRELRQSIEE